MTTLDGNGMLPAAHFSTSNFEDDQRFEAWRCFLPLYTILPHPEKLRTAFEGRVTSCTIDRIGAGVTTFSRQRYIRSRQRISADGQDHFIIQWFAAGGLRATMEDGREVLAGAGDIWVHDLARVKTVITEESRTVSILLPRRELLQMTGAAELDGCVLRHESPLGALLRQHLLTLARVMRRMPADEAPMAALGTIALAAACLRPEARTMNAARETIAVALFEQVKDYIDANLVSPELTPEGLCGVFRISRANLYRLFAPLGGVSGYIRQRRLEHAESLLRDPANACRTIADIAYSCGFASEAHFSRVFRAAFGLPPREIRGAGPDLRLGTDILRQWKTMFAQSGA